MLDNDWFLLLFGGQGRTWVRRIGLPGRQCNRGLLFAAALLLVGLAGCGPEQSDLVQPNSVPVSLNISMPQGSAASVSTRASRFWATLQRWLPTITEAWAQQTPTPPSTPVSAIQVDVTGPDLLPISTTKAVPPNTPSGSLFTIDLDVPVGRDRVFTVSGFVGTGNLRYRGESSPTTLTVGQGAPVEVILTDVTTGTITGTVFNAGTGAPLSNATVTVTGTSIQTTTSSDGSFRLIRILQGPQSLAISASGFTSTTQPVTVVAGTSVSAGTIALTPLPTIGTVTGTVTNAGTGAILPGATVTVTGTKLSTDTLDNGNFTLDGVPQGLQTLAISASGFTSTTRDVTVPAGASIFAGTIALTPLPPNISTVTGTVTNAVNGSPIPGASVRIIDTNLQATTDTNGSFTINDVPEGARTVEASVSSFITNSVQVSVVPRQILRVNISLSPDTLEPGRIRIILNWGSTPGDLDAHLLVPSTPPFEIIYFNRGNLDASPFAQLDTDDRNGFGPETITISAPSTGPPLNFSGAYCYFVHNYSGEFFGDVPLTSSRASIQVLNGNTEIARFTVPSTGTGLDWEVFTLDGATGAITTVDRIADGACGLQSPNISP